MIQILKNFWRKQHNSCITQWKKMNENEWIQGYHSSEVPLMLWMVRLCCNFFMNDSKTSCHIDPSISYIVTCSKNSLIGFNGWKIHCKLESCKLDCEKNALKKLHCSLFHYFDSYCVYYSLDFILCLCTFWKNNELWSHFSQAPLDHPAE